MIAFLATALLSAPLVVALSAAGVDVRLGAALVIAGAGLALWRTAAGDRLLEVRRTFGTLVFLGFLATLAVASAFNVRLSGFMLDPARADLSVLPDRNFFRQHSCASSYTEAARFAAEGLNIYARERYVEMPGPGEFKERFIGPLAVDIYQYPPAFLILPHAALAATADFFAIRRVWFFVQSALLFAAMVLLARWISGTPGTIALLLLPLVWIAPTTRLTLQLGNFQVTAFALAVLAMLAFDRGRHATGGLALGFAAVSKIFPGVLGLVLIATRRWQAVAWTIAWGIALSSLTWLVLGSRPFTDFVSYQLPRIESGEAFFWIEDPQMAPVNQSAYGLVTKLRLLGVPFTGQLAAARASSVYAALVFLVAAIAGWRLHRLRSTDLAPDLVRLRHAQVWLALVSLASFRSPFVPDAYGLIGTLWLLTLVAAERRWRPPMWIALAVAAVACSLILDGGLVPSPVPAWMLLLTLAIQVTAIAVNVAVMFRRQPAAAPAIAVPA